ncbi:hypothetical protein HED60_23130 [Planctomycetales bacterium ZRK34]|nr:hypothetical protein HED60_23130 [Planctomycetales bacterium ZRK34]
MVMPIVTQTVGPQGSGKSYAVTTRLLKALRDDPDLRVITNLPLVMDHEDWHGLDSRIHILSHTERKLWAKGPDGPWSNEHCTSGYWLILDECHKFVGKTIPKAQRDRWADFLRELRHAGCLYCEFIAPDESAIHSDMASCIFGMRRTSTTREMRDPYFKVPLFDWAVLRAGLFGGMAVAGAVEMAYTKVSRRWRRLRGEGGWYPITERGCGRYKSDSATESASGKTVFKLPPKGMAAVGWFARRNGLQIGWRLSALALIFWFVSSGAMMDVMWFGMSKVTAIFMTPLTSLQDRNMESEEKQVAEDKGKGTEAIKTPASEMRQVIQKQERPSIYQFPQRRGLNHVGNIREDRGGFTIDHLDDPFTSGLPVRPPNFGVQVTSINRKRETPGDPDSMDGRITGQVR